VGFLRKNGTIFLGGGDAPVVAPEGDLVFWGKPTLFIELLLIYICAANWGAGLCDLQQKKLGNPS
jgi:hypothetical protein